MDDVMASWLPQRALTVLVPKYHYRQRYPTSYVLVHRLRGFRYDNLFYSPVSLFNVHTSWSDLNYFDALLKRHCISMAEI